MLDYECVSLCSGVGFFNAFLHVSSIKYDIFSMHHFKAPHVILVEERKKESVEEGVHSVTKYNGSVRLQ